MKMMAEAASGTERTVTNRGEGRTSGKNPTRKTRHVRFGAVECPARAAPANGAVSPTGAVSYPNGVTFTCNPGYTLNGVATPTCQADGTWSSSVPTCQAVQCPPRTAPANGAVSPTGAVSYPNGVTFTCNTGYTLNGVVTPTCQADGTWSNPVPTCQAVQCPARAAPANGAVSPTGAVSYPNGVTFTCNPGYTLNGAATPTCQSAGTWSHPVPTCQAVQCPARAAPANGAVTPTGAVSYPNGVTFTCNSGYTLDGAATPTCQAAGTWSHPAPTCEHINDCSPNPCKNGGTCTDLVNGFQCECLSGYTGDTCQSDVTPFGIWAFVGTAVGCLVAGLLLGVAATLLIQRCRSAQSRAYHAGTVIQ
ncbi:E-selectin-like [Branchiostoma floridae x Branchiostoma belcheri]